MKRSISLLILATAAVGAQAQTFSTVFFDNTVGATASFSTFGNTYTANLTGFTLDNSTPVSDLAWVFNFDSNPVPSYTAVRIEIGGVIGAGGTLEVIGSEKVFDMSGTPVEVADGLIFFSLFNATASPMAFTYTNTFAFSQPVTIGQAQKDILHILTGNNTFATIDYISQEFTPVPEPASMAVLSLGAMALLRRRRR